MKNNQFHKNFQLNRNSFSSKEELLVYAKKNTKECFSFLEDWFSKDDFVIVNTSGSTGKPKPIKLQKEFMVNSALATGSFFMLRENTTALLCLSTNYIAGKMMLVRALTLGWRIDVVASVSNPLQGIEKKYDFSAMVPMQLQNSLGQINQIKKLIVGGGVVSKELILKVQDVDTEIFATYGMTETITHIAIKKLNNFKVGTSNLEVKSFYHTLPNVTIRQDERKCLLLRAPKVNNEEVVTNDVVRVISETKFEWLGRYDNVVNSGGIKLHPEEIEEKLASIIRTRFFVAGIADETLGEKLILIIEGEKQEIVFTESLGLNKYQIPKEIYFIPAFIETETGKIQRKNTLQKIDF